MRRPPRAGSLTTAGDAIHAALRYHGIDDRVRGERVVTEWTELVGAKIAARTRPDGIVDRILWVEVVSSPWLHELNLLKPQLVRGLLERLGEPRLFDDLRLKLAGRNRREVTSIPAARRARPIPGSKPLPAPASGARREAIVRDVARVDDEELRELIARVRITHDK